MGPVEVPVVRHATGIRNAVVLLLACLSLAPACSLAQVDARLSTAFSKCMEKAGAVDPAMLECYGAEHTVQDKRLNDAYRRLLGKLEPERKKQLLEVQRQWLRYTEANCSFYYDPDGGTAARMAASECSVVARSARATELEELAK